ncbi:MAG: LamG domain-containing protein, partial [Armatimonadota bacterium]
MGYAVALTTALSLATAGLAQQDADEQPWRRPYVGDEATGPSVIALWQFDAGAAAEDSSGNGHELALRGDARLVAEGKFGECLESFPADAEDDRAQGAGAKNHPDLSPQGAFTLEAWFRAKPEMDDYRNAFLLDKKYYHYASELPRANHDYCLYLARAGENRRRIIAYLGYGEDSARYTSSDVDVLPGEWHHVAFTYDGEGTGRFFLDGKRVGKTTHDGRGAISPGNYGLVIGDRYGSTHTGFPGFIDQVRLSRGVVPFFTGSLEVEVASGARCAFVRMEQDASIPVQITNDTGKRLTGGSVRISLGGEDSDHQLPALGPKGSHTIEVRVDTAVRPDSYELGVAASAGSGDGDYEVESAIPVFIAPRPLPDQMPVVMWGGGDLERLQEIGFTHHLVYLADYAAVWAAGRPTRAAGSGQAEQHARRLDEHLVHGLGGVVYLYPGRWVARNAELLEQYRRIDRDGAPYDKDNICATAPEVRDFAYNVGASVARSFGEFPALQASLIHSEIRDGTNLCFHPRDREAFREFAGYDIPREAVSKSGVRYSTLPDFPRNRVIPDDDPLLIFYRWFWKGGDGWNDLHTQTHKGLKSTGRDDLWTFFDPAVRVPSVWGSGGEVDVASQWTYSYPDPLKIGQATDELFAMADGQPGQQVMKMTQVIWYRSQTAPKLPEKESDRVQWETDIPDARFITISPDHMREAFWSKLSRPIRGIMYHGWGSLVQSGTGSYQHTNPQTKEVLGELVRTVVRPLGPTLLQVPDREADVALLESFASQVFAGRGTRGWGRSWEADAHLVLQWAQLQPRIVYDETILRDGLGGLQVLVMPGCDVLTEGVLAR